MFLNLIAMIVLGILSGLLSFYNKNYYVRVFNDILGRDEDGNAAAKVGRGFFYGFFFPIYFVLLFFGVILLIAFLIAAGIIAAIVFVLVWITEKLLPNESVGRLLISLFEKLGFSAPALAPASTQATSEAQSGAASSPPATPAEQPPSPEAPPQGESEKSGDEAPKS